MMTCAQISNVLLIINVVSMLIFLIRTFRMSSL